MFRYVTPVAVVLLAALNAQAASIFYPVTGYTSSAQSPFYNSANLEWKYLENFEDGALNTPGVSLTYIGATTAVVTTPGPGIDYLDSVDADDGTTDGFGFRGHSLYFGGPERTATVVTFAFDAGILGRLPTYVGLVWTDVGRPISGDRQGGGGDYGTTEVWFDAFDEFGTNLGTTIYSPVGDGQSGGQTAEDRFFGVFYSEGISKITFKVDSTDWEMDHLQYAAERQEPQEVPEPASFVLAFLGAIGGCGLKRRHAAAKA